MNENYIKLSFIWEIGLYKQKSTTEILLYSKEYQDIGKHEFSFCTSFTSNYLKALFKYPKATGPKYESFETNIFQVKKQLLVSPIYGRFIKSRSVVSL